MAITDHYTSLYALRPREIIIMHTTGVYFHAALTGFLSKASQELDKTFNSACGFSNTNEALREHSKNLLRDVGTISRKVHELLHLSSMKVDDEARGKLI